jgi:hypothetical protein
VEGELRSDKKTEVLPRYVKEINPRLKSMLMDYIKKWNVKDMSKLTTAEKRQNKQYYVFYKETGTVEDRYEDNTFSKYLSSAFKRVFGGKTGLSVNTFRHAYNTWVAEHIQEYNDAQLKEIAIDVGDTPKSLPTNLRYRISNADNAGMDKTEIEGMLNDADYAKGVMEAGGGEGGSVGGGNAGDQEIDDDNEVMSPAPPQAIPQTAEEIIQKIGELHAQIARLQYALMKL